MTATSEKSIEERRRFPRIKAPIFCRPAGFLTPRKKLGNISLGGLRIFSDQFHKPEKRMEIEIFLPDNLTMVELVRVVWIKELPPGSEAFYDIGVEFIRLAPENAIRLQAVLETFPAKT
jgi:hypothetical protein